MNCLACGAALSASARFCHKCGAQVGGARAAGWRVGLPWGFAGAVLGALVTVVFLRLLREPGGERREAFEAGSAPRSRLPALDISQMSPEEMATRLFDRVMRLQEEGKQDSVQFFLPMALQTYAQLPALDPDARYDIGLLGLTGGNTQAALAQADTILRVVPTHLYGFMLRAQALETLNDLGGARRAYAAFLRNESAERAKQRPEYAEHMRSIDGFHQQAVQRTAAPGTSE